MIDDEIENSLSVRFRSDDCQTPIAPGDSFGGFGPTSEIVKNTTARTLLTPKYNLQALLLVWLLEFANGIGMFVSHR